MARSDPAVELRLPASEGPREPPGEERPQLRLVATRGQLGVELAAPFDLGPVRVEALEVTFPELSFPVDLSGGVDAFRHRRGRTERVVVSVALEALAGFARPRLARALGAPVVHHLLAPTPDGWWVGAATAEAAVAFEVVVAPTEQDLRFIVVEARGLGWGEPAQAVALRVAASLLRGVSEMVGGVLVMRRAVRQLVRELLPRAGARAPAVEGVAWSAPAFEPGVARFEAVREEHREAAAEPSRRALRSVELAALVAEAEAALGDGLLDEARRGYVAALGRAARHPAIAARLADLDRARGGRSAAALGVLTDVMAPVDAGLVGAELLEAEGDGEGARVAFRRAAEREPYGPLAARALLRLASLEGEVEERGRLLDHAVGRAPGLDDARWARFEHRVKVGRLREAWGDVEHLEAQLRGAARHEVLLRAGRFLLERRVVDDAVRSFERALRYRPEDLDVLVGLAEGLAFAGRPRRGLELLGRALAVAERRGLPRDHLRVRHAGALVEVVDDRPAAIAALRLVPAFSPSAIEARGLEARCCAELGDLAGASAALARLVDEVDASLGMLVDDDGASFGGPDSPYPRREDARAAVGAWLLEGARIHELDRNDLAAARQLLALALRVQPHHGGIREAFRRVARAVDLEEAPPRPAATEAPPSSAPRTDPGLGPPGPVVESAPPEEPVDEAELEQRVENLSIQLRANPTDDSIADALADILEVLGRDHDLLALLSGRIDDFGPTPDRRARRARVLARLAAAARAEGRDDEAALFDMMREQDEGA